MMSSFVITVKHPLINFDNMSLYAHTVFTSFSNTHTQVLVWRVKTEDPDLEQENDASSVRLLETR